MSPSTAGMRASYTEAIRVAVVRTILETYFQGTDYVKMLEDVGLADTGIAAQTGRTMTRPSARVRWMTPTAAPSRPVAAIANNSVSDSSRSHANGIRT